MPPPAPVIAIDGPSASGKGTVAQKVASKLGFHCLDSGSLYRLVALSSHRDGIAWDDERRLGALSRKLPARFENGKIFLLNDEVTDDIRSELCSEGASKVAILTAVRDGLFERQRAFRQPPGLVAEGRDMGSVVFPDAELKVFLTATAEIRAERRHNQLKQKGIAANLSTLLQELRERDRRDESRTVAPLKPVPDARILDTTQLDADQAVEKILGWYQGIKQQ